MDPKSIYKRYSLVGPGGFSCTCCAPDSKNPSSAKARRYKKRQAIKRELADLNKQLRKEQQNHQNQSKGD